MHTNFENENALMPYMKVSYRNASEVEGHRIGKGLVKPSATD
jgi:hypothetical protein